MSGIVKHLFFLLAILLLGLAPTMASSPAELNPSVGIQVAEATTLADDEVAKKFAKKKFKKANAVSEKDSSAGDAPPVSAAVVSSVESRSLWETFAGAQKNLREKVTFYVSAMKDGESNVIWAFLAICFLYGMLHALGPGHGKSIVVGYFLARRGGWRQGLSLGAGITFSHTLSAVVLLFALYAVLKAAVFPTFEVSREGMERISYVLVMFTGILLIAIGVKDFIKGAGRSHQQLDSRASWKEIIGVALVTGLVPCPAVALIVLFCLLNSMLALSLLASLLICLGMMVTNMAFGIMAVAMRKGIDHSAARMGRFASKIHVIVTVVGGLVVFVSGYILFANSHICRF